MRRRDDGRWSRCGEGLRGGHHHDHHHGGLESGGKKAGPCDADDAPVRSLRYLYNNQLTSLPSGIFDKLTALLSL